MAKRLKIIIFPDGRILAKTDGIIGKTCTNYIKILEEILQAETLASKYTKDYEKVEQNAITNENLESQDLTQKNE